MATNTGIVLALVSVLSGTLSAGQPAKPSAAISSYILGPDDLVAIRVVQAPDMSEKVRVGLDGSIELPFIGRVQAAGRTVEALKSDLTKRYTEVVREPELTVSVEEFRSQPVSVIGAVATPGTQQIRGRKTLVEVIAMAGGVRQDSGDSINVTRRIEFGRIPLATAHDDPTGNFSVASVDVKTLMEAHDPAANILVQPDDVISVPRAEMVYVVGEVQRSGGYVLTERKTMSLLEALSLAGGMNRTASPQSARILRVAGPGKKREEMAIDLKKILSGKASDVELHSEDILFIPESAQKRASLRALEAAIQLGTGVAVFRR